MFIRETVKTQKGKRYIQHQLIESIRTPKGPRQKLILNLGTLKLPKDKWKLLANGIESQLNGYRKLFDDLDIDTKRLSIHYTSVIIQKRLGEKEKTVDNAVEDKQPAPQYESVDINSIKTTANRTIGTEHTVLSMMREYKLDNILGRLGFTDKEINYAIMLIIARACHRSSEKETARWINEDSAIGELLKTDIKIYDNALHRAALLLMKNHKEIEKELSDSSRKLFNLPETIILYDLTNTYFESNKQKSFIAWHGISKEKRNDRPIVTLALTIDEDGFPKQSRIFEGNISEPKTLSAMLDGLSESKDIFSSNKTIVIDAGIASEDNLKLIREKQFKYVAVSRRKQEESLFADCKEKSVGTSDKNNTLTLRLVKKDGEAWLLVKSIAKQAKEKAMIDKRKELFEAQLSKIADNLKKKRTRKGYEHIINKIGRLEERYGIGNLYDIKTKQVEGKVTSISYMMNSKGIAKEKEIGNYILRTNRLDLTGEEISKIHRSLTTIENSFRNMKSHLGLRPIYHRNDNTTKAHIFISVTAYHILAGILRRLHKAGINHNWNTIRNILSDHIRVTTTFKTKDFAILNVRNCTPATEKQQEIYTALKIRKRPLKNITIRTSLTDRH